MIDDPDAMVEAVLNVLAPWVDGPPGFAAQRWPVIRFDYEGHMVVPDDDQLRALATQIVTSISTSAVTAPQWEDQREELWKAAGTGEERPMRGGLTGRIDQSATPGKWTWTVEARSQCAIGVTRAVRGVGYASDPDGAKAMVAKWEDGNTSEGNDDDDTSDG